MNDLAAFFSFATKETPLLKEPRQFDKWAIKMLLSLNGTYLDSTSCAQEALPNSKRQMEVNVLKVQLLHTKEKEWIFTTFFFHNFVMVIIPKGIIIIKKKTLKKPPMEKQTKHKPNNNNKTTKQDVSTTSFHLSKNEKLAQERFLVTKTYLPSLLTTFSFWFCSEFSQGNNLNSSPLPVFLIFWCLFPWLEYHTGKSSEH